MNHLTALELLRVWEMGLSATPVHRALYLLAIALPNCTWDDLTQLSIGQRDSLLLTMREQLFGSQLASIASCPKCGEQLEFSCTVGDIRVSPKPLCTGELILELDNYTIQYRLPNSLDLELATRHLNPVTVPQRILQSCILSVQHQQVNCEVADLPEMVLDAIAAHMAQTDPQADLQIALTCPACSHQWQSPFDIVHFLWSELHGWAQRTLIDVHRLALAYGWREVDILAMSPQRRQFYLGMVNR